MMLLVIMRVDLQSLGLVYWNCLSCRLVQGSKVVFASISLTQLGLLYSILKTTVKLVLITIGKNS